MIQCIALFNQLTEALLLFAETMLGNLLVWILQQSYRWEVFAQHLAIIGHWLASTMHIWQQSISLRRDYIFNWCSCTYRWVSQNADLRSVVPVHVLSQITVEVILLVQIHDWPGVESFTSIPSILLFALENWLGIYAIGSLAFRSFYRVWKQWHFWKPVHSGSYQILLQMHFRFITNHV